MIERPKITLTLIEMQRQERLWQETRGKAMQRLLAQELAINMYRAVRMWLLSYQHLNLDVPRARWYEYISKHVEAQAQQWRHDAMIHHSEFAHPYVYAYHYEFVEKERDALELALTPTWSMEQLILGEADLEIQAPDSPRYTSGHGIWEKRVYNNSRILKAYHPHENHH